MAFPSANARELISREHVHDPRAAEPGALYDHAAVFAHDGADRHGSAAHLVRPQGRERDVVITIWDWADPRAYLHDEVTSDKRNPRVNANGPIYGATEESTDLFTIRDTLAKISLRDHTARVTRHALALLAHQYRNPEPLLPKVLTVALGHDLGKAPALRQSGVYTMHDHPSISATKLRAIFEPHQVRIDRIPGEVRAVALFVAVLGASNYTYAEATLTQRVPDWIASHQRAFAFIGGVPAALVCDQLKSGVILPCRYEPGLQRTYEELAQHYGTVIVPARPAKARDKAKVEVAVQVVEHFEMIAEDLHHDVRPVRPLPTVVLLDQDGAAWDQPWKPHARGMVMQLGAFADVEKQDLHGLAAPCLLEQVAGMDFNAICMLGYVVPKVVLEGLIGFQLKLILRGDPVLTCRGKQVVVVVPGAGARAPQPAEGIQVDVPRQPLGQPARVHQGGPYLVGGCADGDLCQDLRHGLLLFRCGTGNVVWYDGTGNHGRETSSGILIWSGEKEGWRYPPLWARD